MNVLAPCPEPVRLKELLAGSLPERAQTDLSGHVETCVSCQKELDKLCNDTVLGPEVAHRLRRSGAAPEPALQEALAQLKEETGTEPSSRDELPLDFLGPAQQPGSLGCLGHYEVLEVLGRGGMGIVLQAADQTLHRIVAIKVMAPELATSPSARKRFVREAQAAAAIRNDHVISIYAVEGDHQPPYLVMEYIDGISLQERLDRNGSLPVKEILRIGYEIARGLTAAHAQGLVHRDIKPANILLEAPSPQPLSPSEGERGEKVPSLPRGERGRGEGERVKITDFGLALPIDDAGGSQSGVVAGTPQYMAPEQACGEAVDHRADLFSLGSVLYAMATGRAPFGGNGTMAVLKRVCEETPRPIRQINPDIPEWLATMIDKLHAKDPAERFQTASEVADLLHASLAHLQQPDVVPMPPAPDKPSGWRRRANLVAAVAAAAVLAIGGLAASEIILRIKSKDGKVTEIKLAPGDKVEIEEEGKVVPLVPRDPTGVGEMLRLEGHQGCILSVAFSPDGRYALSGSRDDPAVRLWDLEARKELRRFEGHTSDINSVAFSSDGRFALTGSHDMTMRWWEVKTGEERRRFEKHASSVWSVALSPNDQRALSAGTKDKTVWLWNVETGEAILSFEGDTIRPCSVVFSSDGSRALTGGWDAIVRVWDLERGQELVRFEGHTDKIESVAFSPDGKRALSGGRDGTLRLWNLKTGKELLRFTGHRGWVKAVAFSPDGRRVLSGGTDNSMILWQAETGSIVKVFDGHQDAVQCVAFSRDGRRAISGGDLRDKTVRIWQLPPEKK